MEKGIKYRIVENGGEFSIEIYTYEIKGFLWWKRKEWSWNITNSWGGPWCSFRGISQPFSKTFKTLKKAKKQKAKWESKPKPICHENSKLKDYHLFR